MASVIGNERPLAHPRHHLICGVDISGYSQRDQGTQIYLRHSMYRIIKEARRSAHISPRLLRTGDRGDGILMVAAPQVGPEVIFLSFINRAKDGIKEHNTHAPRNELRMQLRMALHAGYLHGDSRGFSGDAANHLSRLLDAPALKDQMAEQNAAFAVIVSDILYREVASYHLINPAAATPIHVDVKETHGRAWTLIP